MTFNDLWEKYASPCAIFIFLDWLYEKLRIEKGTNKRKIANVFIGIPLIILWLFGMVWLWLPITVFFLLKIVVEEM